MKNKPWIEDCDPMKKYYGLLNDEDNIFFQNSFKNLWDKFSKDPDIKKIKIGKKLLEFSDNYNEYCQFTMYEKICSIFSGENEYFYWIPISDNNERIFEYYDPLMIAKTPINISIMSSVRRSFMQMQNGGYMIFDSKQRFISIVLDGYYMLAFIQEKYMNNDLLKYIENWKYLDENLDDLIKKDLFVKISDI